MQAPVLQIKRSELKGEVNANLALRLLGEIEVEDDADAKEELTVLQDHVREL